MAVVSDENGSAEQVRPRVRFDQTIYLIRVALLAPTGLGCRTNNCHWEGYH
jgi:hypothetical protein